MWWVPADGVGRVGVGVMVRSRGGTDAACVNDERGEWRRGDD